MELLSMYVMAVIAWLLTLVAIAGTWWLLRELLELDRWHDERGEITLATLVAILAFLLVLLNTCGVLRALES